VWVFLAATAVSTVFSADVGRSLRLSAPLLPALVFLLVTSAADLRVLRLRFLDAPIVGDGPHSFGVVAHRYTVSVDLATWLASVFERSFIRQWVVVLFTLLAALSQLPHTSGQRAAGEPADRRSRTWSMHVMLAAKSHNDADPIAVAPRVS
jgi:hypothetical protein